MRLWSFLVVLLLAVTVGILIRQDPGYALFAYRNWSLEMPLWLAFIGLIVLVVVTLACLWLIHTFFTSSRSIKNKWGKYKIQLARSQTARGLLELTSGNWKKAERYLSQGALLSDNPVINYLSAAKAAEESGSSSRRDQYLQLAYEKSGSSDVAVKLTEAQLQFNRGQLEDSIQTLKHLNSKRTKHPQVLKLLSMIFEATGNWQALYQLLPDMKKAFVFKDKETLNQLEHKIYKALLPYYATRKPEELIKFWHKAPSFLQSEPELVSDYIKLLIKLNLQNEAETELKKSFKNNWDEEWIRLYGLIESQNPQKQLGYGETLLKEHPDSANLLLTLGRLCLKMHLWGKARDYLDLSLSLKPRPETYALLGQVLDQLGQIEKRNECYRKGLMCATKEVTP